MRKSLVETLAIMMAVVICAGLVSSCGVDPDSKKVDTQAQALGADDGETADKSYELTVSGVGGSLDYLPTYITKQEEWFKEEGLGIEEVLFTNGPMQMESLPFDGWDIGYAGVFTGILGYDALVLGSGNTDDGTQYVFTRNNSGIVKADEGHNDLSGEAYGDAGSRKGESILCSMGSAAQYVLTKVLEGFGPTVGDMNFIAMDPAMAYSAFLAGEGSMCVLTGSDNTFEILVKSGRYMPIASGPMADFGLMCGLVVNRNSYVDPGKCETVRAFMEVYFKTMDWMKENKEETIDYCTGMNDESGSSMDREATAKYLEADTYYTLYEAYGILNDKEEGSDNMVLGQRLLDVLDSFTSVGNYKRGNQGRLVGHTGGRLLNEALTETTS